MWSTIVGALPWSSIFGLVIQLVLYIISKLKEKDAIREEFLQFIARIEKNTSVTIHRKYNAQLERVRKEIEDRNR